MAQYSTEAIFLSVKDWGAADRMTMLLSRPFGKIPAVAYGCRHPRSRLAAATQTFSHVEASLSPGRGLDTLKQCEIKYSFRKVREDLTKMAYAAFLAELTAEFCAERQPEPQIFDLLLQALLTMERKNPRLAALAAAYQLLGLAGYQPIYDECASCGRPVAGDVFFAAPRGGVLCGDCPHDGLPFLSAAAQRLIRQLSDLDWRRPQPFSAPGRALLEAERALLSYLLFLLEKPLKSLDFIRRIS